MGTVFGFQSVINRQQWCDMASSSFAPSSITVTVVGKENPGPQQVSANSPLSQAVLTAGGLTRRSDKQSLQL